MKRGRAWRRHMKEKHTIRRLKIIKNCHTYWPFYDVNNFKIKNVKISDYLGLQSYFKAKSYSTDKWETRHKVKYSPNKSKDYWRYKGNKNTREYDKKQFFKILKEYGIK